MSRKPADLLRFLRFLVPALMAALAAPALAQESAAQIYDVLLKNGHVLDPGNGRDAKMDVALTGNRVARVGANIPAHQARRVIEVGGYYVTPGLIDLHAYVDTRRPWLAAVPEHNSLRHGVTTVVDAGSTGSANFEGFQDQVVKGSRVRILAFLHIRPEGLAAGLAGSPDAQAAAALIKKHPDFLVGVRSEGGSLAELKAASEAARATGKPLLTSLTAETLKQSGSWLPWLQKGDLITYAFGAAAPLVDSQGALLEPIRQARQKGVLLDLGHGSRGFWFRLGVPALRSGLLPDVVSTGMDRDSLLLPRANMSTTLSKLASLGVALPELIRRASLQPAQVLGRPELGALSEGSPADVAVWEMKKGRFGYLDSGHARLQGDTALEAVLTIRDGRVVWDTKGLGRTDWIEAGPYSNYR